MTTKRHLTYMLIAAGAVLLGLWAFGLSPAAALPYALFLACPLMMVFMMFGMNHSGMGHGSAHDMHQNGPSEAPPDPRDIDAQYRR